MVQKAAELMDMTSAEILRVKYLGTGLLTAGLIGISGYGSTIGTGPEARVTKQVEDLIKKKDWKSVKIKWKENGGNGGQNGNGWDFALVKANEDGKNYCTSKGFKTAAKADWTAVYESLGWNVETKKDNDKTQICIWKISSEDKACGRAISCL